MPCPYLRKYMEQEQDIRLYPRSRPDNVSPWMDAHTIIKEVELKDCCEVVPCVRKHCRDVDRTSVELARSIILFRCSSRAAPISHAAVQVQILKGDETVVYLFRRWLQKCGTKVPCGFIPWVTMSIDRLHHKLHDDKRKIVAVLGKKVHIKHTKKGAEEKYELVKLSHHSCFGRTNGEFDEDAMHLSKAELHVYEV